MEKSFTKLQLQESPEFKTWVTGKVVMIHDVYYDSGDDYAAYIVIHKDKLGKYTITRFFKSLGTNKVQVSVDYTSLAAEEVFVKLLMEYSSGLRA